MRFFYLFKGKIPMTSEAKARLVVYKFVGSISFEGDNSEEVDDEYYIQEFTACADVNMAVIVVSKGDKEEDAEAAAESMYSKLCRQYGIKSFTASIEEEAKTKSGKTVYASKSAEVSEAAKLIPFVEEGTPEDLGDGVFEDSGDSLGKSSKEWT